MHLGGNRRLVAHSFENNNNNNKRYPAHKFYFTVSSAVSSIQVHSRGSSGGGMFYSGSLRGNSINFRGIH